MKSIVTGIDLVEIARFELLNPKIKERFLQRVYTQAELDGSQRSPQHLAGLFAAKEAAAKALGCGIGKVKWKDLEITSNAEGKPELILHEAAKTTAQNEGWYSWSLSISHTRSHAVATVTALIERPKENHP